jgi:hypothetical protein
MDRDLNDREWEASSGYRSLIHDRLSADDVLRKGVGAGSSAL